MSGTICRIKNRYSKEYDLIKEALLNRQDLIVGLGMSFQDISLKEYLMHDDTDYTLADNLLTAKDKKSIIRNIYNELTEQQKEEFRANNPDLLKYLENIQNNFLKGFKTNTRAHNTLHNNIRDIIENMGKQNNSAYNITQNSAEKLNELLKNPSCPFVLFVGCKKLVIRQAFEQYIEKRNEI